VPPGHFGGSVEARRSSDREAMFQGTSDIVILSPRRTPMIGKQVRQHAAALMAVLSMAGSAAAAQPEIGGHYSMEGKQIRPAGAAYRGECDIRAVREYYEVNCVSGEDKYFGKAYLAGRVLSLYLGEYLVVYDLQDDGRLAGKWVHIRSDAVGEETLLPAAQ
jgi:hypothetical protein